MHCECRIFLVFKRYRSQIPLLEVNVKAQQHTDTILLVAPLHFHTLCWLQLDAEEEEEEVRAAKPAAGWSWQSVWDGGSRICTTLDMQCRKDGAACGVLANCWPKPTPHIILILLLASLGIRRYPMTPPVANRNFIIISSCVSRVSRLDAYAGLGLGSISNGTSAASMGSSRVVDTLGYYAILGLDVRRGGQYAPDDIKTAYRARAMEMHPDKVREGGSSHFTSQFLRRKWGCMYLSALVHFAAQIDAHATFALCALA